MAFDDKFHAPAGMRTDEFLLRPVRPADNELDYAAVMASKSFLRVWEGTGWPADDFTLAANLEDMVKLEQRYEARESFAYTVMNLTETECLGCVYIDPPDVKWLASMDVSPVDGAHWSDYGAVVTFWIRTSRLDDHLDRKVLDALHGWLTDEWPISGHLFLTSEALEQQVTMIEGSGLQLKFRLKDGDDDDDSLVYG